MTTISITPAEKQRLHKRTLIVVILSQVLGGAGLAAGIAVGALLAQDLLHSDGLSGLPAGLFTLGSALSAFLVGQSTQRFGRRRGLAFGFMAGGLGAVGVVVAAVLANPFLLFASLFVYGSGMATNLQARYAGADLAPPEKLATGASMAMVATTLGAVAGPNLIEPMGRVAEAVSVPALAGPFMLAACAYLSAGLVLFIFLRPDPFLLAKELAAAPAPTSAAAPAATEAPAANAIASPTSAGSPTPAVSPASLKKPKLGRTVFLGATVMTITQFVMVAIMTMTPIHMRAHDHTLGAVGLVIGMHIGAMWLPSLVTGIMVDRFGRLFMVVAAAFTLLAAGILAATASAESLILLITALVLLGVGWNFGLVSGTALVVDGTVPENRAKTQGSIDVLIALSGSGGGILSGVIVALTSYQSLSIVGGILALVLLPVLVWAQRTR